MEKEWTADCSILHKRKYAVKVQLMIVPLSRIRWFIPHCVKLKPVRVEGVAAGLSLIMMNT